MDPMNLGFSIDGMDEAVAGVAACDRITPQAGERWVVVTTTAPAEAQATIRCLVPEQRIAYPDPIEPLFRHGRERTAG